MVLFNREDYLQAAVLIAKDSFDSIKAKGLDAFRATICNLAPFLKSTVDSIRDWDDVKLLTVRIDRLRNWSRPGFLCIGDAAHAMSPAGGVGINLAIQDAVAAANILLPKLMQESLSGADLIQVQRRREWPTKIIQRMQMLVHNNILNTDKKARSRGLKILRWITKHLPFVRGWLARLIGFGPRPEHVETVQFPQ
jgi:2-polyprenyl-6-methoxyphenol hydroxylase-like FAD-dependent oxidoreductase